MDPWQIVAVLASALAATWTAFITAFFKGDLIPGHVYRREVARGDQATTQAERNAKAIQELVRIRREELAHAPSGGSGSERPAPTRAVVPARRDRGA